ncbi:recombination protein RecR [Candidatus Fermentibacteria bacterium]|nr:recombination protein RecR [Candidatus Fermentibacteria bacterium]
MTFPGVGRRSAQRMVYFLMADPSARIPSLIETLQRVEARVRRCAQCNNLAEEELCAICVDPRRDPGFICVVAEPRDLDAIEATGTFRGLYHVLGGVLSPLDGVGPGNLAIEGLMARAASGANEIVLALSATVEAEATASYLIDLLKPLPARVTRLARGIPSGGSLEYLDPRTLGHAVAGRVDA